MCSLRKYILCWVIVKLELTIETRGMRHTEKDRAIRTSRPWKLVPLKTKTKKSKKQKKPPKNRKQKLKQKTKTRSKQKHIMVNYRTVLVII